MTPILKSGHDIEDFNNSRPISLLPILSKVSQRLASQSIYSLTESKKLAKVQSGNRKMHSTKTALFHVTEELLEAIDAKNVTALILRDLSKA